jgi:alpha-glucosidase
MISSQMGDRDQAIMDALPEAPVTPAADALEGWRSGVVYQVYPRSFSDTDGDGVGDLAGILDHLDYLNDGSPDSLGIDAIWLSPIYPSAGFDSGYDVSDYSAIDRIFGTLSDFERLVAEAHRRGIRVILDLVLNHTSHLHPWFVESRASRTGLRSDWYIWRDPAGYSPAGRPRRPNNWVSFFGGPAWTWDATREQFYLHTFLPQQPDLNWRNPAVRAAVLEIIRTWLDRGVDGFRFDVFNAFFKHADLPSNPYRLGGRRAYSRQVHLYDKNQPELVELLAEIRQIVDELPGRMTVGELFEGSVRQAAAYTAPGHLIFDFSLIRQPWSARAFARAIAEREAAFGPGGWPTIVLSNHDQSRSASRYDDGPHGDARVKVAATLLLTLRGTPFLYYGEEIGLRDVAVPWAEIQDPAARRSRFLSSWWNRDQARAPMPWGLGPNAGFSTARPWLRMSPESATRNVASQTADPRSVLSYYRRLIWLRRSRSALSVGSYEAVGIGDASVFAYLRRAADQAALVVLGFGRRAVTVALPESPSGRPWRAILSTHDPLPPAGDRLELRPLEAVIFVDD